MATFARVLTQRVQGCRVTPGPPRGVSTSSGAFPASAYSPAAAALRAPLLRGPSRAPARFSRPAAAAGLRVQASAPGPGALGDSFVLRESDLAFLAELVARKAVTVVLTDMSGILDHNYKTGTGEDDNRFPGFV